MTEKKKITLSGTCLTKNLSCKLGEIKSIDDLKKKITSETNIKENQFSFEQKNPFEYFKKMKYGDSLIIKLNNLPKKVLFYLHFKPDIKHNEIEIIEMQNIPTKRELIIKNLNSEGIFLSDICKTKIEFDFSKLNSDKAVIPNISVDVDESKIKTIKFYKYFFLFDINESVGTAQKSIENFLKVGIGSHNSSAKITQNKLNEVTGRDIKCTSQFTFITPKNKFINVSNNILSTILDAKTWFAKIYNDDKELTPKDIVIKHKGTEIDDDNKLLLDFGWNHRFSFDIKKITTREAKPTIEINFISEESSQIKFDQFTYSFGIDTAINTIGDFIREKFNVDNKKKVDIKYDENNVKYIVDIKMNLEDILEEMKQKNDKGEPINVLYIEIKDKPVRKPKKIVPKTQPVKEDQPKPAQKQQTPVSDTKKQPVKNPQKPAKTSQATPAKINYIFKYEKNEKKLELQGDSLLKDHEKRIKELFDLDKAIEVEFKIDNQILDPNKPLNSIDNSKVIQLLIVSKPNVYLYQTNKMNRVDSIELGPEATVKDFKIAIAKKNHVDNLANIKILFAGKDLLDDIVLVGMNIGNDIIYVYIRSTEDILLMSAKCFNIDRVDFNNEEEEEYSD